MGTETHLECYDDMLKHLTIFGQQRQAHKEHFGLDTTICLADVCLSIVEEIVKEENLDVYGGLNIEQIKVEWKVSGQYIYFNNLYTFVLCHGIFAPYYNWVHEEKGYYEYHKHGQAGNGLAFYKKTDGVYGSMTLRAWNEIYKDEPFVYKNLAKT